ncbi:MAG: Uma2 family endonuclease [candidate division WOR-3 bacterium]
MILDRKIRTYDDYLKLSDDKRFEVIRGRFVEMVGASFGHQNVLTILLMKLRKFCDKNNLGKVIPYIVFISNEKLHLIKHSLFGVPDLVVEVVSDSSEKKDKIIKKRLYEKFGVKEYWIVEPNKKKISVYVMENNRYALYCKSKVLEGFEIDLKEVFE